MEEGQKKVLGTRLREARKKIKLSQGYVAESLAVTRQAISMWENGINSPSAVQLAELSALYCVCAHTLLFGSPFQPVPLGALLAGARLKSMSRV